jgi:ubiquitin carboxyl-terminal hydrolase 34
VANERYENFYPLSLEIKGYKSIEDSFKKYIQGEIISDYQCDSCKKKTDVTKSCYLASTPNYFIIHLTRMCFNYDKFENEKVNSRWEFPHKLNLWEYSLDKLKGNLSAKEDYDYELKGTVLHYGTADFGHYFSYIKESENQWIEFNDERVREYDPRDIESDCFGGENWRRESQNSYLLVFEKVKKRPVVLEFDTEEEKEAALSQFGLKKCVVET